MQFHISFKSMRKNLIFIFLLILGQQAFPQVVVQSSSGRTPYDLVSSVLVGGGVSVSNVTFNGISTTLNATTGAQIGTFTNNLSGFPALTFSGGLIMATGDISVANGPNDQNGAAYPIYNSMTCPELDAIISGWGECNNPAILEFDFVTIANTVTFNYVFASEEYPDFVNSSFNDVFGFFVTDMVTNVTTNIALIPGTTQPVTINNVNQYSYSQYYHVVADYSTYMQYNAFVGPFAATMSVVPCRTYHMKLAISNVSDTQYDSAVFFQAQSFTANAINIGVSYDHQELPLVVRGCNNGLLTISMPSPISQDTTIHLEFSGTAVNGVDIQTLPHDVTIPAGQTSVSLPIVALPGHSADTLTFIISYNASVCTDAQQSMQIVIRILNDNDIDITSHDINSCSRLDSISIELVSGEIGSLQWYPSNNLSNPNDLTTGFLTPFDGVMSYTVIASDKYNCMHDTTQFVFQQGTASIDTIEATICEGKMYTDNGFHAQTPGYHTQTIASSWGCDSVVVLHLTVLAMNVEIVKLTEDFCENYSMELEAITESPNLQWSTGETTEQITVHTPGSYTATVHDSRCSASAHVEIGGCPFELIIPNAFTPSLNDGTNDVFYLPNINADLVQSFTIYIYDRWGKLVFYSDDPLFRWDGKINGKKTPQSVFSYQIYLKTYYQESKQYKGHITIL